MNHSEEPSATGRRGSFVVAAVALIAAAALAAAFALADAPAVGPASTVALDDDDDRTLYALGLVLAQQLSNLELEPGELLVVQAGLADGVADGEPRVELETFGPRIEPLVRARTARRTERLREAGTAFRERAAAADGAETTESGLVLTIDEPGVGAEPATTDLVRVHYEGRLTDGELIDSSRRAGEPAAFRLDQAPACIGEGLARLRVGGRATLVCPPELAYGDAGFPPRIPPAATIVFEVELLEIVVPADAAASEPAPAP